MCAFYEDDEVWCSTELDDGSRAFAIDGIVELAGWRLDGCARTAAGRLLCWRGSSEPTDIGLEDVTAMAYPGQCGCAVAGGEVWCWRFTGAWPEPEPLSRVDGLSRVVDVDVWCEVEGLRTACAVTQSGEVWCWGENESGQLGDGTSVDFPVPVRVTGL